jgi:tetratricopeptide (TPR) repeat protein
MYQEENEDQIERYLSGEMSEKEEADFEKKLASDAPLREAVYLQRDLINGINFHFSSELKTRLNKASASEEPPKKSSGRWFYGVLGLAASFLLLVLIGYWYLSSHTSPSDLYAANYQPYPNIINPLERSGAMPEGNLDRAMIAYEQGKYEEAISLFRQEEPLESNYQFYLALSLLEQQQAAEAIGLLDQVIDSNNEMLLLPAHWYQGLAYLKNQQPDEAESVFSKLHKEDSGTYGPRAKEILDQL